MGCAKCNHKKDIENKNEFIYNDSQNKIKKEVTKNFIIEELNNQGNQETEPNNNKIEIPVEEKQKLAEMKEDIKLDKNKMKLLRKCQARIRGMQFRRNQRKEKFQNAKKINFDLLIGKDFPLQKDEIDKFFDDYPQKNKDETLKLERKGSLMFENRIIYYGEWDINFFTKHGRGMQIWPDGSYYKGYWENHKAEGKGKFVHSSGDVYEGNWHLNKREGKGVYHSKKGMEYIGGWKNDKQEGQGEEKWEDGTTYTGQYLNGKKNGKGFMQWANGSTYNGFFENGNIKGKGVYHFADNRVYEGDFANNVFEGKGVYTWPNGNKYRGNFKNDKRDGFGIFTFADGRIYKGVWKNGKQYGEFNVYNPKYGEWNKKKWKEYNEDNETKKNIRRKSTNNNIIFIDEDIEEQEENAEKRKVEDNAFEIIDSIRKTEINKIDELDEEDF